MVPYSHPVYHNGKRVLWHGVWRGGRGGESGVSTAPKSASTSSNFSVFSDGDDSSAFRMAGDIVAAVKAAGVNAHPTVGRTDAASLEKLTDSDIVDFAIVPLNSLVDDPKASWKDKAPYVTGLGLERIEIVASKDVAAPADLDGKTVAVGPQDSADEAVAKALFQRLGVKPTYVEKPLTDGLSDLAAGKVAAVVATGETDSKALGDFGKDGKAHLVALPMSPQLAASYSPLTLTAKDRPNLIGANEKVATLAEPMALIAMAAPANSPREQRDAAFISALFDRLPNLMTGDADPAWRDVNIAATLDWPRVSAAEAWIAGRRPEVDAAVTDFRNAAASDSAHDANRLFNSLLQARSAAP